MQKSRDAFRTISEVAEWLDVPTHVLRFWESRFSQIKPVKRAGGRRYYRPSDMRVIGGVKTLLHDQGMTIRGVQKLFREEGIKHVSGFSPILEGENNSDVASEAPVLIDRDAIPAVPAPAARASRDAVPDPTIDETGAEDDDALSDAAPIFTHQSGAPRTTSVAPEPKAPAPEPELKPEPSGASASVDTFDAAADPPGPTIPKTPDVPLVDPEDDAPEFATTPGIAARLLMADRAALEANRADILKAAERLKALLAAAP